jgi:hypothetical protein
MIGIHNNAVIESIKEIRLEIMTARGISIRTPKNPIIMSLKK